MLDKRKFHLLIDLHKAFFLDNNKKDACFCNSSHCKLLAYHGIQVGEKLIDNCSEITMMSMLILYKYEHNSGINQANKIRQDCYDF